MGKTVLILLFVILMASAAEAVVRYDWFINPFSGKQDRSINLNQNESTFTAKNLDATEVNATIGITLNGNRITAWPVVSASAGDKWLNGGTFIYPNSSFANNVLVEGYIYANDWTNVTVSYSQIYDFNPDDYYLKSGIPNCNSQQKITADGEGFICATDFYNTTAQMRSAVLPAIGAGRGIATSLGASQINISFDCSDVMDTTTDFNCGDGQEVTLKNGANYITLSNTSWVRSQFSSSTNISFDSSTGQFWINMSIAGGTVNYASLGGFSSANETTYANHGGFSLSNLSGSSNISIDANGKISINMSIAKPNGALTNGKICVYDSGNDLINCTYTDQVGSAADYDALGGWTNVNNTNANVIFSTNSTWITYATLGGFSSANQTTYANLGGWSSLNNTADNVIRSTNSTWITYATLGGFSAANETTYVNHGGYSLSNWSTAYTANGWQSANNSADNVIRNTNTSWVTVNEKTYAAHGGFTIANQSYSAMGGFTIANQSYSAMGGFTLANQSYSAMGGFTIANQSYSSMGGFTKTNETTYSGHGGFAQANLSIITASGTTINITTNNITMSNTCGIKQNATCMIRYCGSTRETFCI